MIVNFQFWFYIVRLTFYPITMRVVYKNKQLEKFLIAVNVLAAAVVAVSFVFLFGFVESLLSTSVLYTVLYVLLLVFVAEKVIRLHNSLSKTEYLRANWFEIPLLIVLAIVVAAALVRKV